MVSVMLTLSRHGCDMKKNALLNRVTAIRDAKPLDMHFAPPKKLADSREQNRTDSYKYAMLKMRNGMRVDCAILNYHNHGVKITLRSVFTLPEMVKIIIPELGINRDAKVVWQSAGEAGLHFSFADD